MTLCLSDRLKQMQRAPATAAILAVFLMLPVTTGAQSVASPRLGRPGLFGTVGRPGQLLVTVAVWIALLNAAPTVAASRRASAPTYS
jgi:hypothetical protein